MTILRRRLESQSNDIDKRTQYYQVSDIDHLWSRCILSSMPIASGVEGDSDAQRRCR